MTLTPETIEYRIGFTRKSMTSYEKVKHTDQCVVQTTFCRIWHLADVHVHERSDFTITVVSCPLNEVANAELFDLIVVTLQFSPRFYSLGRAETNRAVNRLEAFGSFRQRSCIHGPIDTNHRLPVFHRWEKPIEKRDDDDFRRLLLHQSGI